jgi:hypothetical protein
MEKVTAKQITTRWEQCIDLLSEVVQIAHAAGNDSESKVVRRAVGYVLSEIQDRLGDPIYREHPDLLPKGVDYAPLPGATLKDMA